MTKQLCVQLPTSADNVALLAFAAARRAATWLRLAAGHAAIDRYLLVAGHTAANPPQRRATNQMLERWTNGRTYRRTPDRYIDPVQHTGQRQCQQIIDFEV